MKQVTTICDIVIPIFNRPDHTRQTLESLLNNTNSDLYNLYIVDDCSIDPEIKKLINELYRRRFSFWYDRNSGNIGPGASRNSVCDRITKNKLRSKYLYHSDNDVYFKEGWLEKLIKVFDHLKRDNVKVLGGGCHPYLQNKETLEIFEGSIHCYAGIKDAVSGYSQLMTWETWDKYGPFDETMRGQEKKIMGSEDFAFCQKIIKDGFKVGSIEPEVVIQTGKTNTYNEKATGSETFLESTDEFFVK